jgi:limonene-1,2-epoxide hydrolase
VSAGYVDAGRGFGIADLASTQDGAEPRAGGTLAYHALEVMESVLESAHSGSTVRINSTVQRPASVELTVLTERVDALQAQEAS